MFDDIVENEEILKRARDISSYYDELIKLTNLYHMYGEGDHQLKGKTVHVPQIKETAFICA